jgi:flavin reductase (DIM6/NTAB) family NADH-FMN oxidoreductase RutF
MPASLTHLGALSFASTGTGEAVILAGPGTDGLAEGLANFRVIRLVPPVEGTAEELANAFRRVLDELAIASANVVAAGPAASAALALAVGLPARVRRLALIDPDMAPAGGLPQLTDLRCPVLFMAGPEGQELARGLAQAAPRGQVVTADGAEQPARLGAFLAERLSPFDNRELRTAFGTFMTGVTIVTTAGSDGTPRGFTANSFTSVSLEPPLLMMCVGKQAASVDVFRQARGFAINILAEQQKDISVLFASKRPDKFQAASWRPGPYGNPLIDGAAAWFDCSRHQVLDAGDHMILMGRIEAFSYSDANPLGYARGGYITLGLEQAAVNAASSSSRTVVGAVLENDNRLILLPDGRAGGLALPEVGRSGANGSASQLHAMLEREGIDATLGFLFAVYENATTKEQFIYYRGEALLHARGRPVLASFDDIPWDRLPDEATRIMLRRYAEERKLGRFKVYSADHRQGKVRAVD